MKDEWIEPVRGWDGLPLPGRPLVAKKRLESDSEPLRPKAVSHHVPAVESPVVEEEDSDVVLDTRVEAASIAGDLAWLEAAKMDSDFPAGVRVSAAKEATKLRLLMEREARDAREASEWKPPGSVTLRAQAIRDVLRLEGKEVQDAMSGLGVTLDLKKLA